MFQAALAAEGEQAGAKKRKGLKNSELLRSKVMQ